MAAEGSGKEDAILKAALELFAERGFHGTAVPLVAERAGVGAGTIYRYFASKEALVNVLYRHWKSAFIEALVGDFPAEKPAREQFRHVWHGMMAFARQNPLVLQFLELHHHTPYLDEESRQLTLTLLMPIAGFLDEMRRQLITKEMPSEVLMAIVWGAFVGLVKASREGYLELSDAVIEMAETCCWEAIRR
jgi:TetR/AcrR family transcriptional regulator, repressor of fatR-cypB operon